MRSAPTSQEFTVKGASFSEVAFPTYDGPLTGSADQLRIRYDATAGKYEILEPQTSGWRQITPSTGTTPVGPDWSTGSGVAQVQLHIVNDLNKTYADGLYSYSALVTWSELGTLDMTKGGVVAFGVASSPSSIPVSGNATYDGAIYGFSTETWDWADWGRGLATVDGKIQLTFDFSLGTLAGSISPRVYSNSLYELPTMKFVNTVYANGSPSFSGKFDTSLTGENMFSGLFTGPQASELIGNFAFPYTSALDGKNYEAGGGLIAKKP
jgi:hypothetical protein